MYSIALKIYMHNVAALTGFIKWMILHITDSMKILTSEKGSPDDLQGSFVIVWYCVLWCSIAHIPLIKILLQSSFFLNLCMQKQECIFSKYLVNIDYTQTFFQLE